MEIPQKPKNEKERLAALRDYDIMDTSYEPEFDEVVALASFICQTPIATITLIDERRQWFKAQVGMKRRETPRDEAFCAHAILQEDVFIVNDATSDNRFHDNPSVLGDPVIRFYAGIPLTTEEGHNLGTICVIDTKVRELTSEQNIALKSLRNQVMTLLDLRRKNIALTKMQDLQQKLLSIISHDMRSPINSIDGLLRLAERDALNPDDFKLFVPQLRSGVDNASSLLNNLLGWAKNHVDGKHTVEEKVNVHDAVKEASDLVKISMSKKSNTLKIDIDESLTVMVRKNSFYFVVRNLVHNANKFTDGGKITVSAGIDDLLLKIQIENTGVGISKEKIGDLFTWGKSNSTKGTSGEIGSGLGLPMVKEFVEQMGGSIAVDSTEGKSTIFYLTIPLDKKSEIY